MKFTTNAQVRGNKTKTIAWEYSHTHVHVLATKHYYATHIRTEIQKCSNKSSMRIRMWNSLSQVSQLLLLEILITGKKIADTFQTATRLKQYAGLYSVTSMMRGHINSEWRTPREWEGEVLKAMVHFSGLWAPGPGFLVASRECEYVSYVLPGLKHWMQHSSMNCMGFYLRGLGEGGGHLSVM